MCATTLRPRAAQRALKLDVGDVPSPSSHATLVQLQIVFCYPPGSFILINMNGGICVSGVAMEVLLFMTSQCPGEFNHLPCNKFTGFLLSAKDRVEHRNLTETMVRHV